MKTEPPAIKSEYPAVKSEYPAVKSEHKSSHKSASHGETKVKKENTPIKMEIDKSYGSGSESGSNSDDSRLGASVNRNNCFFLP